MTDAKPERTAFFLQRVLQFTDNTVVVLTLAPAYDNRQAAEKAAENRGKALNGLLMAAHLCTAHQAVDGQVELVSTGIKLGAFTGDLGIKNIGHRILEMPVQGADLVVPQKRIILPH